MRILLLFAILFCSPVYAQAPPAPPPSPIPATTLSIAGPSVLSEYALGQYTVPGASSVGWTVFPLNSGSQIQSDGSLIFTAAPGTYQVLAATSVNGNIVFLTLQVTIQNTTKKNLAIAVFDSTQLTSLPAGQVAIWQSTTIASSVSSKGYTYLKYDINDVIPTTGGSSSFSQTKWGQQATASGLPALVLVSGGQVTGTPLQSDETAVVSAIPGSN